MINAVAILLISLGSFLEVFYYIFRFTVGDGDNIWIAIIKGVALTGMLSGITLLIKRRRWFVVPFVVLTVYSILCTSAGQSMQYSEMEAKALNKDPIIATLTEEIVQLKTEAETLSELRATVDLGDQWKYEGVIKRTREESDAITKKIIEKQKAIEEREAVLQNSPAKIAGIYGFYNALFSWPVRWSQFSFQTALSLFIALMAPFGILLLDKKKPTIPRPGISRAIITDWVFYTWYLFRNKGQKKTPPDKSIIELMRRRHPGYTEKTHKTIKKAAFAAKTVDNAGTIVYTNERKAADAVYKIINGGIT